VTPVLSARWVHYVHPWIRVRWGRRRVQSQGDGGSIETGGGSDNVDGGRPSAVPLHDDSCGTDSGTDSAAARCATSTPAHDDSGGVAASASSCRPSKQVVSNAIELVVLPHSADGGGSSASANGSSSVCRATDDNSDAAELHAVASLRRRPSAGDGQGSGHASRQGSGAPGAADLEAAILNARVDAEEPVRLALPPLP
jgi:hypothetical protein